MDLTHYLPINKRVYPSIPSPSGEGIEKAFHFENKYSPGEVLPNKEQNDEEWLIFSFSLEKKKLTIRRLADARDDAICTTAGYIIFIH